MAVQISFCGYNGNTTVHTIGNCGRIGQKYEFSPFNIKIRHEIVSINPDIEVRFHLSENNCTSFCLTPQNSPAGTVNTANSQG